MTIQFRCSQCDKLLSAPDDAAGKQAKCPSCSALSPITAAIGALSPLPFKPGPGSALGNTSNPFADAAVTSSSFPQTIYSDNPYAASTLVEPDPRFSLGTGDSALTPCKIEFSAVLSTTYATFMREIGTALILGVCLVGLVIAAYMGLFAIAMVAIMATFGGQGGQPAEGIAVFVLVGIVGGVAALVGFAWVQCIWTQLTVRIVRGDAYRLSELQVNGGRVWRMVLLNLLCVVLNYAIAFGCAAPGLIVGEPVVSQLGNLCANLAQYIVGLHLFLGAFFIVDRDLNVFASISESNRFMRGNKLVLFLLHLVVMPLGIIFIVFTLGLGTPAFLPFCLFLSAVVYVMATGQPTAEQRLRKVLVP